MVNGEIGSEKKSDRRENARTRGNEDLFFLGFRRIATKPYNFYEEIRTKLLKQNVNFVKNYVRKSCVRVWNKIVRPRSHGKKLFSVPTFLVILQKCIFVFL